MSGKLAVALNKIRYFCATQLTNFCVGMALAVLMILNLWTFLPTLAWAVPCPLLTAVIYVLFRAISDNPKNWKGNPDVRSSVFAAFLGGFYAVILTLI